VPALQLLGIYTLLSPMFDDCGALLTAVGKPKIINNVQMVQAAWVLVTGPPAVHFWGMEGASLWVGIAMALGVVVVYRYVGHVVDVGFGRMFTKPVVSAVIATGVVLLVLTHVTGTDLSLLAWKIMLFAVVDWLTEAALDGRDPIDTVRLAYRMVR